MPLSESNMKSHHEIERSGHLSTPFHLPPGGHIQKRKSGKEHFETATTPPFEFYNPTRKKEEQKQLLAEMEFFFAVINK